MLRQRRFKHSRESAAVIEKGRANNITGALEDLNVLLIDCQATAAHSAGGHLIEIGWAVTRAVDWQGKELPGLATHLLRLPPGIELAPRIGRLTGIGVDDLASAPEPKAVWNQLLNAVAGLADVSAPQNVPAVIHFSRFEAPFLDYLHRRFGRGKRFCLRIICTHKIVKRLLPGMPRRGLRAAAGYFGHGVPETLRCANHVTATAAIWANCVALLAQNHAVRTLEDLDRWLIDSDPPACPQRQFPMPHDRRIDLPDEPGVYRMRRSNNDLLYIGKAASLKKRVASYFHKGRRHPEHILEMLTQARDLEETVTGSALEAALLESDRIKAEAPPYNRALTEKNRQLVYCARNFSRLAPAADLHHPLGPLPDGQSVEAMSEAAEMIAAHARGRPGSTRGEDAVLFGFSGDLKPDEDCLARGVDVFRQRHPSVFEGRTTARAMSALGARLWKERLAAGETSGDDDPVVDDSEENRSETSQPQWSPESVADVLEGVICRGARMIRRSRWLCMLSESALSWTRKQADGQGSRLLVISGGAVISSEDVFPPGPLPVPPGWARTVRQRQRHFDVAAYDRLRIITTELRRLLVQARGPRVCLGPGRILGPQRLARGLAWI